MFKKELLDEYVKEGWLRVQKHPGEDLFIYNYTSKTQYERNWNDVTISCRGLILNQAGDVVAKPFNKFFNLSEIPKEEVPNEAFEVFEKMDGSLGILYWVNEKPFIASRGSFTSEQAVKASALLHTKYKNAIPLLEKGVTYIFEIIYPENRIVVDYGDAETLVLIGAIEIETGTELPLKEMGFPLVERIEADDFNKLQALDLKNKEGFVIRFKSGYRLKVKFDEYQRVHRIITQVSNLTLWECLRENTSLEEIIDRVPDEFYDWVKAVIKELKTDFKKIERIAKSEYKVLATRKESAVYFETCTYPKIMFNMLNEKKYDDVIWRMIRPDFQKPFDSNEN
tara:strand:- start:1860 stop:2876 length:1017 start_codon:yes stop_codon:yes gene_type:complete